MLQLWHAKIVVTPSLPPSIPPSLHPSAPLATSSFLNTVSFVLLEVAAVTCADAKLEQLDSFCYSFLA